MSELPSTARVVIIGGGAVGASSLYHLAKAGWTDCLLLEKNELTAGSTWHAAGNVPTFSSSWSLMNMQRYSAELYRGLGEAVDYPMNYHVTGSVRLGHSRERLQEFRRVVGMGRYQGMDLDILAPDEIRSRYPFAETHDLTGALYDPNDGDIDPAQLTQALAKGARDMGAKIVRFCPVTAVRREKDEWVIVTPKGEVRCEYVVNAAGYYAREVGRLFGRDVPMMVMSHQYMLFDTIPELEAWSKEAGYKLPLLRDVDSSYYLRQEKYGMNLGPYERNCKAHWVSKDDPMPEDFSFQLFPDDLERLEWYLNDAIERVPVLGTAGLSKMINGPIPYAPDGNPLIGPMPGVPNAFEACVFTFGICQAGGAGKVLAEWVMHGETEWDMWSCDPRRYTDYTDPQYCVDKGMEIYGHEYAMHFPRHYWPAGRDRKHSAIHDRVEALGAQFKPFNGWERAMWYAKPGDDTSEAATQTWNRKGPWSPRIEEECLAVRDAAGILDLPGFSRYRVKGPGATEWLKGLITGRVPKPGRIGLAYFSDDKGRIVTEMSVIMLEEDFFFLITAATAQWHDFEWLRNHLPADAQISMRYHGQVRLVPGEEEYKKSLRKRYKSYVNWGRREMETAFHCGDDIDADLFDAFRLFHARIAGRVTRPRQSWDEMYKLAVENRGFLCTGFLGGEMVAATYVFHDTSSALYGTGVYERDLFEKPISHWPMYASIVKCMEMGLEHFDLGEVFLPADASEKEKSIGFFKKGFSQYTTSSCVWTLGQ